MSVCHIGNIATSNMFLSDTFLVPNLSLYLISVGQLCDLGLEFLFSRHGCYVQDPYTRHILGTGCKVDHLFEL